LDHRNYKLDKLWVI